MIRKKEDCAIEYREKMRDGNGTIEITNFITGPAELCEKGRLFSKITVKSGCSIGYHVHEKDSELFYFLKGNAKYNDNGTIKDVCAGDVAICPAGCGHGVENAGDETVEIIAVIVYAGQEQP
ncbi:MAG: cupin domain-containing protein [Lachnospiraceae bacterium]|nr:cupin domain-containing protein [Lachnospiraceae bacterium]